MSLRAGFMELGLGKRSEIESSYAMLLRPPLDPVPKCHIHRMGTSPLPWVALLGLENPIQKGIFPISNLNTHWSSSMLFPPVLSLVQSPIPTWFHPPLRDCRDPEGSS